MGRFRSIVSCVSVIALAFGLLPSGIALGTPAEGGGEGTSSQFASGYEATSYEKRVAQLESAAVAYRSDSIIVVFNDGAAEGSAAVEDGEADSHVGQLSVESVPDARVEVIGNGADGNVVANVELPADVSVAQAVANAEREPNVAYAQPNYTYRLLDNDALQPQATTNDPIANVTTNSVSTPNQWGLSAMNVYQAWDMARCNNQVTVAVLDTGINFEHEDLAANIDTAHAYDAVTRTHMSQSRTDSDYEHGTHVAGIVAGVANNGTGIAGVSYNANILPINVFHEGHTSLGDGVVADDADIIAAYSYLLSDGDGNGKTLAQETNTRVVNMSLGGYLDDPSEYDHAFEEAINKAQDAGILTVAAGGNGDEITGEPRTDHSYPSDYDAVMSVVSLRTATQRSTFADYNDAKDISAPGQNIYSTLLNGNTYGFKTGTSMASPAVAGVAALLWAYEPDLTVAEVKDAIYSSATDLGEAGRDDKYGWGAVNAAAAIEGLGNVRVSADRDRLVRTQTLQLSASVITDRESEHRWLWSVDRSDLASVDDNGVLTALAPGEVTVTATAADDSTLVGTRKITVNDIALPAPITVAANPSVPSVTVSWDAAEAATGYTLQRSIGDGDFESVATFAEDGSAEHVFIDTAVAPGVRYRYRVVPWGTLGGQDVRGVEGEAVACYFTDKTALSATIVSTRELLEGTSVSEDGSDCEPSAWWTAAADRAQLNAALKAATNVYLSSGSTQEQVDQATADLAAAQDAFNAARRLGTKRQPLEGAEVQAVPDQTYTGNPLEPALTVTLDKTVLVEGTDYQVTYRDNTAVGMASYTVTGIGRYEGTLSGTFAIVAPAKTTTVERLAGDYAVDTAAAIAARAFEGATADTVVIARDDDYFDALSGAGLAGALGAPVLLTRPGYLSDACLARAQALGATHAVILGGTSAVSDEVARSLEDNGIAVERVWGEDAYGTSLAVARKLADLGGNADYAVAVNPTSFADAVSISGWAYRNEVPILLQTWGDTAADRGFTAEAKAMLAGRSVIVCGGEAAVSDESVAGLSTIRLGGNTIYDTSRAIAEWEVARGGMSASDVCVASAVYSSRGVDALAASALAGRTGGVVLLVQSNPEIDEPPLATDVVLSFLGDHAGEVATVHVLGGTAANPQEFYERVEQLVTGQSTTGNGAGNRS